ncbi:MAG: hypothetical protein H7A32_01115 [Deltaproteobacteria bacterium]|nr:hypothetical protein [Deltaproteobacteria bacterium]
MEKISINEIKKNFAYWAKLVEQGEAIQITKYNRPYLQLTQIAESGLHCGKRFGKTSLKTRLKRATKGHYLSVLSEDRGDG